MPASEVMRLYRQHKLHSGPGGPVVKKKSQATAIQISMARKEGHDIPEKKSFQQGGLVPESAQKAYHTDTPKGTVKVGGFSDVNAPAPKKPKEPDFHSLIDPVTGEWPGTYDAAGKPVKGSFQQGGLVPASAAQAQDIADRTRAAQEEAYQAAMHQRPHAPWEGTAPGKNDPAYAVQGLQSNVAQRMREQGEQASAAYRTGRGYRGGSPYLMPEFRGGGRAGGGRYLVHKGEMVTDSTGGANPGRALVPEKSFDEGGQVDGDMPDAYRASAPPVTVKIQNTGPKKQKTFGEDQGNPELDAARSAVAGPLARSSANFDSSPSSFKRGGRIPSTGIYRLHAGEHVIPANLAARYRQMKERHG